MISPLLPHSSTAALILLLLILVTHAPANNAHAQTAVALQNGNEFENIKYTDVIIYDANAKLKDETAYSSVILWKSCTVSSTVTIKGTFDTSKTFATSLYLMFDAITFSGSGQFYFNDLPPNSYVHAVKTRGSNIVVTIFDIRPTTESNNITTLIDDSTIEYDNKVTEIQFVNLAVPDSSPFIVTHLRSAKLTSASSIFKTTTCTKGSTIFLEKITCTACRYDLILLTDISSISEQSAIILKEINIVDHARPIFDGLLRTGDAVNVDASSVLAVIDIDLTNDFRTDRPLPLFYSTVLTGEGAIVFLRIKMGLSGLTSIQPANNKNFWVVAKKTALREMTADELREAKFNVNANNIINWDGTGSSGKCVQVGLALPGTATYELVNGKCEATCPQGNYLQPACTPRAVCTGVPNCQACYAHPKTLCLECLPHTTAINGDTVCKCPIRECVTCPTATLCTNCTKDYKFSPEDNSCFHCTIDKCSICREDGKCFTCEDGHKLYNNQCIACGISKCEYCKEAEKCFECIDGHKPTANGKTCFHCTVPFCKECSADGVCRDCLDGYYLFESESTPMNNKCVRCSIDVPKCIQCETDGNCSTCITDHKPANAGTNCFHCTIPFCKECSADGVCGLCDDGYSLTEENTCVRCSIDVPKCDACKTDGNCSTCITHHKPANAGTNCFHCTAPFCTECSGDGVCGLCDDGYYLLESQSTPTDNKCVRCSIDVPKCTQCETDGNCSTCITDHKPANAGTVCFHCTIPFCKECSADGMCGLCNDGYSLTEKNTCVRCSIDVPKCDACKTDGNCSTCITHHKPANAGTDCFHCTVPFCTECSGDGVCGLCDDGYYLVESQSTPTDNKCVRCSIDVPKCDGCKTDGNCSTCITHHKPANAGKVCFHCTIPFCKECSADGVCGMCNDGYSLTENTCVRCSIDVPKCDGCKTDGNCSQCIADHKPANAGTDCFHCTVPNCTECSADGVCGFCDDGYYLLESQSTPTDNKCVRCSIDVPNCRECKFDGICSQCNDGYTLSTDGSRCTPCHLVDGCQRCDLPNVCALCKPGMSVNENGGACTPCDIGNCTSCSGSNACALCTCGMVPADDGQKCVLCRADHCEYCDPSRGGGTKCAECVEGYAASAQGICSKIGLPSWIVFLIVLAASMAIMTAVVVAYILYMRHLAHVAEVAADAEERRLNRQCVGKGGRHHTEISILDLGDIENAASGIRDTLRSSSP